MAKSDDTPKHGTPISYAPETAAAVTGRSRTRIFKALKSGELTARKDGRATIIEHQELQRWVSSMPTRPAAA
jgi:excisionase family DNA binding protein